MSEAMIRRDTNCKVEGNQETSCLSVPERLHLEKLWARFDRDCPFPAGRSQVARFPWVSILLHIQSQGPPRLSLKVTSVAFLPLTPVTPLTCQFPQTFSDS